jgi:hypothetical protein
VQRSARNFCSGQTFVQQQLQTLSVKELQQLLNEIGVAHDDCFDKQDLMDRAESTMAAASQKTSESATCNREERKKLVDDGCTMAERADYKKALANFRLALQLDIEQLGADSVEAADNHFNIAAASGLLWTLVPAAQLKPENELLELAQAMRHIQECIRIRPVEHMTTAQAHLQAFEILYATAKLREMQLKQAVQQSLSGPTDTLVTKIKEDATQCLKHAQKGVLIYLKTFGDTNDLLIDARVKSAMASSLLWEVTAEASFQAAAVEQLEAALASSAELHGKDHNDPLQIEGLLRSLNAASTE